MREINKNSANKIETTFTYSDFVSVLRKRWLLMLVIFIAISIVGIYRIMQKTHMYRASARIAFNQSMGSPFVTVPSSGRIRYRGLEETWFLKQLDIIRGEQVARRVAESLKLIKDPKDQNEVNRVLGFIRSSVGASYLERTDTVLISGISENPEMTYKLANATAEAYIRYHDDKRYLFYKKSVQGITEQIADLEKKLDVAQQNLIDFIKKEKITSYGETRRGIVPPVHLDGELDSRRFLENLNNQKVESEIELGKLRDKYLEAHPKIKKTINDLDVLAKKIKDEEKRLAALKDRRENEIIRGKEKEIQYSILKRKVEVNKQMHDTLLRNLQETDMGSEVNSNHVEIMQYAQKPNRPFAPNKRKESMFVILIAFLVSLAVGVVLQYVDSTFKSIEDIEGHFEYPILSSIPFFKRRGKKEVILVDKEDDESNLKEAFRLLRTNLRFALSEKPGKQLIVTSTQKGEGKSTIAVNLGLTMAEAGANTLVVDSDVRVRSLKNFFGVKSDKGLTNYLSGKAGFDEVVMPTHVENLSFVHSGPIVKNPSLLFESTYMKDFIKEADTRFDFILFDAPPVGYVVDASLFCSLVDGVLMVIESEAVARKSVTEAVERLLKGKANIHGIVFNKEAFSRRRYYYKYYQYYGKDKDIHV